MTRAERIKELRSAVSQQQDRAISAAYDSNAGMGRYIREATRLEDLKSQLAALEREEKDESA